MSVESIGHEFKLSVRRDEGDCSVILKAGQTHTLVELGIFQLHRLTLTSWNIINTQILVLVL